MSGVDQAAVPYGLHQPTLADAQQAVHRVHGPDGSAVWADLLASCRLSGRETDGPALARLIEAMIVADPVTQLCGQALRIRVATHEHLSAAYTITRS
ncbi:hypothetical protein [Actinoplanes sp. NPDC048796]|uniref:hypothetical protein n=1 Tax=unclassified Actinoplanes TaxID=2626549 RepID=UPI0033CC0A75